MVVLQAIKLGITLVVLPLGDSITAGVPTEDGYRAILAEQLAAAGITARYVGSQRSRAGAHEGWTGYTADELIPPARAALARHRPDVVLLHIGTNDLGLGVPIDRAVENVGRLLSLIDERSRQGSPGAAPIRVFLAQIIGRDLWGNRRDEALLEYNARLAKLAAERRKAGQPIVLVDMHAAIDPRQDLVDALHPSARGYQKMATAWATAVRQAYASARPNRPPPSTPAK